MDEFSDIISDIGKHDEENTIDEDEINLEDRIVTVENRKKEYSKAYIKATEFDVTMIIATRAEQISKGDPILLSDEMMNEIRKEKLLFSRNDFPDLTEDQILIQPYEIAKKEFDNGLINNMRIVRGSVTHNVQDFFNVKLPSVE